MPEVRRKQAPPLFLFLSLSLCVSSFRTQTCKCARLTQAASTCNVSLWICRNIYRSGDLVQTSAFSSLSKAHSDCKKAKGKMSKLQRFSRKKIHMQNPEHQSNPLAPSRSPHAAHWSAAGWWIFQQHLDSPRTATPCISVEKENRPSAQYSQMLHWIHRLRPEGVRRGKQGWEGERSQPATDTPVKGVLWSGLFE